MIEVQGLTKEYDGFQALKGLSFTVPTGAIFAFIGPNGAGKTTTLKVLSSLLKPDSGKARVMGVDVMEDPAQVRRMVGWMPDQYGLYGQLKVWEYLDFFAAAYRLPKNKRRSTIESVLELLELTAKRDAPVSGLSRGMTQKLCLGRALLHEPPVLLLDEPASGLDPQARIELRELLRELQGMGKTILVSSHILPELAEYCTGAAIIQEGQVRFCGTMEELKVRAAGDMKRLRVVLADAAAAAAARAFLEKKEGLSGLSVSGRELQFELRAGEPELVALLRALVEGGHPVLEFNESRIDLGDVFMKLTGEQS